MKKWKRHLTEIMDEQGMTPPRLAELVGCSRQNIYYLKRGVSVPNFTLGLAIAKALFTKADDIFFGRLPERLVDSGAGGGR